MLSSFFGITLSGAWALSGRVRRPPPLSEPDRAYPLQVINRRLVAHDADVVSLTLAAPDGTPLPRWSPGSHLNLRLPSGRVRQYSLCGDPESRESYRIAVRRIADGGGGSVEVHDELRVGATASATGPRNAFPLSIPGHGSPSQRLRFVAGGIGITPILPMVSRAERLGVDWSMVYAGRSVDSLPFLDEIGRYGDRVVVHTDDAEGVPTVERLLGECSDGTAVYVCGPATWLTTIRGALAGRNRIELHFERFSSPPVVDGEEFSVSVASSGTAVHIGAGETLLSALHRAGVEAPYSCRQGFCGTCRIRVLDGFIDHRETRLTKAEHNAGMMLACRSRASRGQRLTLDL
jgi:ferredoxin-NADP reductase